MNLKATYNKIAEDWFKNHQDDTWWVDGTNTFISFMNDGDLVLDAGCGAGVKSHFLLNKGMKVTGIDFSEKMIEIAKREVPTATFSVMDIKELSGLSELFDGILAQAVLLHFPKKEVPSVINGLATKLKVGGYLYIAVKEKRPDGEEEGVRVENDLGYEYERFFSYFTLPEIKKYISDAQMQMCYENIARTGNTNWIQVIAKKE